MKTEHPSSPKNKKEYISKIGVILVKEHGKKKYYKPEEVKIAAKKAKQNELSKIDWACWAMCTFSSHSDFDSYHRAIGESCDYVSMKTEMLSGLSLTTNDWSSIPDLDIDSSWLDFGEVFENIFEGIGDFVGAIFDNLDF